MGYYNEYEDEPMWSVFLRFVVGLALLWLVFMSFGMAMSYFGLWGM